MGISLTRSFEEIRPLLGRICAIADRNRDSFGFLPSTAYSELAAQEQLWVAKTDSNPVAGYVLFGASRFRLRIFQLFVDEGQRGRGIGSFLISELKLLASKRGYQTISARVAADLAANGFWERAGFRVIRQVAGGQTRRRVINERYFEVAGASLWEPAAGNYGDDLLSPSVSEPILSSPNFALDLNTLFDVTKDRDHAALMREVMANAFRGDFRLCVTAEFSKELERTSAGGEDPILRIARSLPTLPSVPTRAVQTLVDELRRLIFPDPGRSERRRANDDSDLMHLALCVHHKVSGFITRESAILRKGRAILQKYGLEVLSPADLSTGEVKADDAAVQLQGTIGGRRFSVATLDETGRGEVEEFLERLGVTPSDAARVLDAGSAQAPRMRSVFTFDSRVIAIATWGPVSRHTRELQVFLVADEEVPEAQRAVDHVLEAIAQSCPQHRMTKIDLMTTPAQISTRNTALKRGFVLARPNTRSAWMRGTRYASARVVTSDTWAQFAEEIESVTGSRLSRRCPTYSELMNTGLLFEQPGSNERKLVRLFDLETAFAPALILAPGRGGVIVPIREDYANELIGSATKQLTLFAKEAPTLLERAYFARPGLERAVSRGAIVVFYISGRRNEAVGLGRVTASGRYSVEDALRTFARQGVLSREELQHVSTDEKVGVFTFDAFRTFPLPIPFAELRARQVANAANLVTAQQVSFDQLVQLLSMAGITKV